MEGRFNVLRTHLRPRNIVNGIEIISSPVVGGMGNENCEFESKLTMI